MGRTIRKRNDDFTSIKQLKKSKPKKKLDINSIIGNDLQDSYEELFDISEPMNDTKQTKRYS